MSKEHSKRQVLRAEGHAVWSAVMREARAAALLVVRQVEQAAASVGKLLHQHELTSVLVEYCVWGLSAVLAVRGGTYLAQVGDLDSGRARAGTCRGDLLHQLCTTCCTRVLSHAHKPSWARPER